LVSKKSLFGVSLRLNQEWPWCPDETGRELHEMSANLSPLVPGELVSGRVEEKPYYSSRPGEAGTAAGVRVHSMPGGYRFLYADGTEFEVDLSGREIQARWPLSLTLEDTLVYLHGPVVGFALRLRGVTCLHASAIAVDGRVLAIVGSAGMGKSTTAAALAQRGYPVQTDDLVALTERGTAFWVQPGLPRVLLWPESAEALWGHPEALPRVVPTWPKLFLDLRREGYRFSGEPLPLGAIYVLGIRRELGAETSIEPLRGNRAFAHLVANTYANYLLDADMRAHELQTLGRVIASTPVRMLRAPEDRGAIAGVCDALLADFRCLLDDGAS